jgi:hypothetical protein
MLPSNTNKDLLLLKNVVEAELWDGKSKQNILNKLKCTALLSDFL